MEKTLMNSQNITREITVKGIILSGILAVVLAIANTFLALKIGILTSASIPAAILAMGILRLLGQNNILENNLVQTAASAGEAVAGGIVYTIPALIIIGYWQKFGYWENFFIALTGGALGVWFSVPLRRILVSDPNLSFPEGRAITEVLKLGHSQYQSKIGLRYILMGGLVGALIECGQTGFKILINSWQVWFVSNRIIFGFGAGFSAAMIGAGYLIGIEVGSSIFVGALLSWMIGIPLASEFYPQIILVSHDAAIAAVNLWSSKLRYIGIGAMLTAGLWTCGKLFLPLIYNIKNAIKIFGSQHKTSILSKDKDIPNIITVGGILLTAVVIYFLLKSLFSLNNLPISSMWQHVLLSGSLIYILVFGFLFCAITGYFSGLVGVTASPGSAIVIAGLLIAALALSALFHHWQISNIAAVITTAKIMTIVIGAVITTAACIANDNIQDLKVGYLLGATPWKQQIMLLVGVILASAIIPVVMQLLFNTYGIANVLPHAGMDTTQSLPAPPAAVMAALTEAVFRENLPWNLMFIGAGLTSIFILFSSVLNKRGYKLSVLGVAIGMYLPLASSIPLFLGALIAYQAKKVSTKNKSANKELSDSVAFDTYRGTLIACGLVAGAALMDVIIAVPLSLAHSPDALSIVSLHWLPFSIILSIITTIILAKWMIGNSTVKK